MLEGDSWWADNFWRCGETSFELFMPASSYATAPAPQSQTLPLMSYKEECLIAYLECF